MTKTRIPVPSVTNLLTHLAHYDAAALGDQIYRERFGVEPPPAEGCEVLLLESHFLAGMAIGAAIVQNGGRR